jgi:hypothetical protein
MRKFTIVGGGQAGLMVAIGLLKAGHKVRVVQNRSGDQIAAGKVMSSQCMFSNAVQHERDLGLDHWSPQCPPVQGINFIVPAPDGSGAKAIDWTGRLERDAFAVDQRLKMPRWLKDFVALGGELQIDDAGVEALESYAAEDDLVIVAAGKGEVPRCGEITL